MKDACERRRRRKQMVNLRWKQLYAGKATEVGAATGQIVLLL